MPYVASPFAIKVADHDDEELQHDERHAGVQEVFSVDAGFGREEAHINELVQDYIEDAQRHDPALDDTDTMEFGIVNEAQIIFVHIVLEKEENHAKERDIGHYGREEHRDRKGCQSVRHVVSKIESICINEGLWEFFPLLLRLMTALAD